MREVAQVTLCNDSFFPLPSSAEILNTSSTMCKMHLVKVSIKNTNLALAGVAQWIERQTAKQRITGSIPSQGTCLDCRPGPQWGARERQPHIDVSLPLFLPPFPSVQK